MNLKTSIATFAAASFLFVTPVLADDCSGQYGGQYGDNCKEVPQDLVVNKDVKNAITRIWVENLSASDVIYAPGNDIEYRLTIKNTSGETFSSVYVKDVFPPYVKYVSGAPSGATYNSDTRTLEFTLNNMIAGEQRQFEIRARVVDANQFPADKDFCVNNYAFVSSTGRSDDDTAQVCLNANIAGVTTLPKAGFNDIAFMLPYVGMGLGGAMLLQVRGKKKGITE